MSLRVRFTESARSQFHGALRWVAEENPTAARHLLERVEKALVRVSQFPESGRHLPEFPDLPHREVIVSPYRIFYRLKGKTIWVVGIWHSRQLASTPVGDLDP